MYKNILVPIDGSSAARRGLLESVKLAKVTGGSVRLVHVANVPLTLGGESMSSQFLQVAVDAAREAGRRVLVEAEGLVRDAGVLIESRLAESLGGAVADSIIHEIKQWPADVVVMGTHGRRGLSRLVLGSDAELVLRASPVPVLLVREQPEA